MVEKHLPTRNRFAELLARLRAKLPTGFPAGLLVLIIAQFGCASFFALDVVMDFMDAGLRIDHILEAIAVTTLLGGMFFEVPLLLNIFRRNARLEESLKITNQAVYDIIEYHFQQWNLTPAEHDIATFLVKGFSTTQIARLRNSAEGTIKAQLNAIYRKSGTTNRSDLLSVILDAILAEDSVRKAA